MESFLYCLSWILLLEFRYRAFDELEGIEVAWNQIKLAGLLKDSVDWDRLFSEVHLLKTLKHKNIIKFYNSWVDAKNEHINFITEIFVSGTLRQYVRIFSSSVVHLLICLIRSLGAKVGICVV